MVSTIQINISSFTVMRFIFCSPNKLCSSLHTTANVICITLFDFGLLTGRSTTRRVFKGVESITQSVDEDGRTCSLRTYFLWIVFVCLPLSTWTLQLFIFMTAVSVFFMLPQCWTFFLFVWGFNSLNLCTLAWLSLHFRRLSVGLLIRLSSRDPNHYPSKEVVAFFLSN